MQENCETFTNTSKKFQKMLKIVKNKMINLGKFEEKKLTKKEKTTQNRKSGEKRIRKWQKKLRKWVKI